MNLPSVRIIIVAQENNLDREPLDRRLTWSKHMQKAEGKDIRRLFLMKKLAGTTWGANSHILKTLYTGSVRPVMEYGISALATAFKSNTNKLFRIQRRGPHIITAGMKTTPINEMEKVTGIKPLTERRKEQVLIHSEKLKRLPSHPACERITQPTKNRLNRQSFNHILKAFSSQHKDIITNIPTEIEHLTDTDNMNSCLTDIRISTTIPDIDRKEHLSPQQQKALTQEMLDKEYNTTQWIHVYTDGSADQAIKNGGSGIYLQHISRSLPTGKLSTNYRAEQIALVEAVNICSALAELDTHLVFLIAGLYWKLSCYQQKPTQVAHYREHSPSSHRQEP
ncbi:uncharacterized protein LOC121369892 [Gigantopelta aegis]|uniref:uncharacterized protein LOC121369892 n=1 Tax=Gigantopelta aegis TaxID=1735272 RepID=UPI001B88B1BF|nr:uncharacterized protein LOC121369892 [Gigantopelta aegis]